MKHQAKNNQRVGRDALIGAMLVVVTSIAYMPAMRGEFLWDDDDYVSNNMTLRDAGGLVRIWTELGATRQYYPLVYSSFWVEYHLWGLATTGYHVVNVLLHAGGAILLWRVLRRLAIPGALLAAYLFAVHPIHVESVAWITERKNVLSGILYFASALFYLNYSESRPGRSKRRRDYVFALICFAGAMLSKTVACTLPAAMLLAIWWKRGRLGLREFVDMAPFFAIGIGLGLTTLWLEHTHVGTGTIDWQRSPADRLITAGRTFWFYLGKIAWPVNLTFVYPHWRIDPRQWFQWLAPAGAMLTLGALWIGRSRWGRGPAALVFLYAGTLLPASGLFDVYYALRFSPVADHFVYLASIGPIILAASALARMQSRLGRRLSVADANWLVGVFLTGAVATLTWKQCSAYQNLEALWQDTLNKNPDAALAHNGLGVVRHRQGRAAEAEACYRRAIALDASDPKMFFNLGLILQQQGKLPEAMREYESALRLNPDHAKCLVNMGNALLQTGRVQEAIERLTHATRVDANYATAHANLAAALARAGKTAQAISEYESALRLNPGDANSTNALAELRRQRSMEKQ